MKNGGCCSRLVDASFTQTIAIDKDNGIIDVINVRRAGQDIVTKNYYGFIGMADDGFRGARRFEGDGTELARAYATEAREFCDIILADIRKANESLQKINHPRDAVSDESVGRLRTVLTSHVNILLEGILSRERTLPELRIEAKEWEDYREQLKEELEHSNGVIEKLKEDSSGLGVNIKRRLETLGFDNVDELVDRYVILQDRIEVIEKNLVARSAGSNISRAPSTFSLLSERCPKAQTQAIKGGLSVGDKSGAKTPETRVQLPLPENWD
uniref:Uncharacterized protein n=1 Tax=Panagrolaimus superbus TaxID=310955 RepID=A0A914Z2J3_9BILA